MTPALVKRGFTLAEVLITLAIIGVVAALTLPTLLTNIQDRVREKRIDKNTVPVGLIDKTTNKLIREFRSIYQAHKITGLNEQEIASNIHGKRRPFKIGYFVILEKD